MRLDSQGRRVIDDNGNWIAPENRRKPLPSIRYAEDVLGEFILVQNEETAVTRKGVMQLAPGQNQDGYGQKISTDIMLQVVETKRRYRVYCTCRSNAGSLWIKHEGQKLHLHTYFQDDLQSEFLN